MPQVKFAPAALRDLDRLRSFLRSKSPAAGRRAAEVIIKAIQNLEQHPEMGRPVDGMGEEYRELVIGFGHYGYVALYRVYCESVVVLAIRHQREAGYIGLD